MFTRDEEAAAATTGATVVAPPPAAPAPEPEPEPGQPPSSRGWTVFMEPSTAAGVAAAAGAPPLPSSAPAPSVEATPAGGTEADPAAPPGPRRGWTMFMEAPIDDAGRRPFGPTTPTPAATPAATPAPAEEPSSDNRGWTVFGAPSPAASAATVVEGEGAVPPPPQQHGTEAHSRGAHDASVAPVASGSMTAVAEPDPAPGRAKTVVASGVQAVPGSVGGVTGRTVFPASGQPPGEMPDTMYFRRGDIPAERPTARSTTAVDVAAPVGRPPVEERDAQHGGAIVAPGRDAPIARDGGRRMAPLVAVGVVVVGLVVAAVIWLT